MRNFTEPTARNLLRRPLVLGVPLFGLILLAFAVLTLFLLAGSSTLGSVMTAGVALLGYLALRTAARFAKSGWEERLLFPLERLAGSKKSGGTLTSFPSEIEIVPPDTLDETDLISRKDALMDGIVALRASERMTLVCDVTSRGALLHELKTTGRFNLRESFDVGSLSNGWIQDGHHLYSLHQLPVTTDPLWLFAMLSKLKPPFRVLLGIKGVDFQEIKQRIEVARRGSSGNGSRVSDVDAEVTFEESSHVLKGLSRGDEAVVELSLVIASVQKLELDSNLFCEESNRELTAASICGVRPRFFRSHAVRAVTAADLIPNILDPVEDGASILTTFRGAPLYFSPQDPRLEALHWLVVGASGSGKSFFTGLVLKRMIEQGCPMAVLFVDHNRSFRRFVRNAGGTYLEPKTFQATDKASLELFDLLNSQGAVVGMELSDLNLDEKKAAVQLLLSRIEAFLKCRDTTYPVYIVLDECWNFMRDNPLLVQRAFREFRKLNGAVVAITQSLHDFLTDESGQSIFQNAPVRVLLRQGEDLTRYQGVLSLNSVEMARVRLLRQKKGVFSECLIKTPFLSRFGRLYPSEEEHGLLRTDNLRAEQIAESRMQQQVKAGPDAPGRLS